MAAKRAALDHGFVESLNGALEPILHASEGGIRIVPRRVQRVTAQVGCRQRRNAGNQALEDAFSGVQRRSRCRI